MKTSKHPNVLKKQIDLLSHNAQQKLDTAELVSRSGDYNTASAILVTAFEERTKAVIIQLIDLGFPLFKEIKEYHYLHKQHDLRHYIGFFIDCIYEVVRDIANYLKSIDYKFTQLLDIEEISPALTSWICQKVDSFIEKVNFYQNIENKRQNGLYIDVLSGSSPQGVIGVDDYTFIKNRLSSIHTLFADIMALKMNMDERVLKALSDSTERFIELKFPVFLSQAVQTVQKKRNKAFKVIKRALVEYKAIVIEVSEEPNGFYQ